VKLHSEKFKKYLNTLKYLNTIKMFNNFQQIKLKKKKVGYRSFVQYTKSESMKLMVLNLS